MIPFASQRGGGQDLATHLLNDYDNDLAEVAYVRGAIAKDLHGAFKEWEIQAETLTKCRKYFYSLSINPDPLQGPLSRDQYLLESPGADRHVLQKDVAKLYDKRSAAAHGKPRHEVDDLLATFNLLRNVLIKIVDRGEVPSKKVLDSWLFGTASD